MTTKVDERAGGTGLPDGFVQLPGLIYRDDPAWIPESSTAVERAFSASNPWFASGESLAVCVKDKVRAAAFTATNAEIEGPPAAFFGYWDSVGDGAAERVVMERLCGWAKERGAEVLYGPINFSTYGSYRFRVFAEPGWPTFPGEPYNHTDYPGQIEALGFEKHMGYVTEVGQTPKGRLAQLDAGKRAFEDDGFRFESLTPEVWCSRLPELHPLIDQIFGNNFAYTPLSWEAFSVACGEPFVAKACPVSSVVAFDRDDGIASFALIYPNYGPLVCASAGADRVEVGQLRYGQHMPLLGAHGPITGLIKTVGVARQYRRRGIYATALALALRNGGDLYADWFGALMRDDNASRRFGDGTSRVARRYVLYRKNL